MLNTVSRVLERVEPPAPNVTDMYSGFNAASRSRVRLKTSTWSSFFGGKNSKLNWGVVMASFASNSKAGIRRGLPRFVVDMLVREAANVWCRSTAHEQQRFSRIPAESPGPAAGPGDSVSA